MARYAADGPRLENGPVDSACASCKGRERRITGGTGYGDGHGQGIRALTVILRVGGLTREPPLEVPSFDLDGSLELHVLGSLRSQAPYTIDFRTCSSAQISATVSRRSSAIAARVGGSGRSERVSPASVDRLHSITTALGPHVVMLTRTSGSG